MESVWQFLGLCLAMELVDICSGYPLNPTTLAGGGVTWGSLSPLLSAVLLACSVLLVFGCLCCRRTKGFQEFTDSGSTPNLSTTPTGGYVNNATSTEFPLFPPPQPTNQSVRFEPLPEIVPPNRSKKPAAFNNAVSHGLSEQDWFAEGPGVDFPRQQLTYVREAGRGWFGRVVEGNAQHIVPRAATTPVVVKILRDDASPTDQMFFLHEVRAYRDLGHPNVLRMLGRCLEADPFLVLLEACPTGDLKSFLCQNISTARALSEDGVTLNMACNIAAGLEHMLANGFVHTDLAARNCLVTPDLSVKIGDYGHSIESFKEDYYIAGDVALPVRWCAPETVYCTDTIIQTKEVTTAANVWSLGVLLWEIAEFGKLPYGELTDDEVVCQVFGENKKRLPLPSLLAPQRDNLYLLMKLCWSEVEDRPALKQVHSMLQHLNTSRQRHQLDGQESSLCTEEDFNRRWETFKPNTIPKRDDHNVGVADDVVASDCREPTVRSSVSNSPKSTNIPLSETTPVVAVTDHQAALRSPLHLALDDHNNQLISQNAAHGVHDGLDRITPSTTSPQLSLASSFGGEFFSNTLQSKDRSVSLQNLRGSLEDLNDNSGQWDEGKKKERKVEDVEVEIGHVKRGVSEATDQVGEDNANAMGSQGEPDFDSWLKGVETTDEEEAKFVAKISEAIRDLDDALALEKTSSSSSEASSKQQTPVKDFHPSEQNSVLDFRLGRMAAKEREDSSEDSLRNSNSSDTEEETWRRRIERGEFSEKVKEKSKSVADLMVLTHIDPSDGSDSEPPSLTWSFERGSFRTSSTRNSNDNSFSKPKRDSNKNAPLVSNSFGSEGDIHKAVLGEEFLESLQKIQLAKRDGNKNILSEVANFLEREKKYQESIMPLLQMGIDFLPTNHNRETNFLVFDASGQQQSVGENRTVSPDSFASEESFLSSEQLTPKYNKKREILPELISSEDIILNVDDSILSQKSDAGSVSTSGGLECVAITDTVLNLSSASVDSDRRANSPNDKTEVAFRSQVPELETTGNVAKSLQTDTQSIENSSDGKTNTTLPSASRVESIDDRVSGRTESMPEEERRAVVPEIVIDSPCVEVDESPALEVVARKPVPLPRRTLRIVCKDPGADSEKSGEVVQREAMELTDKRSEDGLDPIPKECPTFYTSTPCAPKAAPRIAATSDMLLCNMSEITTVLDADHSTNLSNCSALSWDDTMPSIPNNLNKKPNLIQGKIDLECTRSDVGTIGTTEEQPDLAIVNNVNQSSSQETCNSHVSNESIIADLLGQSSQIGVSPIACPPITISENDSTNSTCCDSRESDQNKEHRDVGNAACLLGKAEPGKLEWSSVNIAKENFTSTSPRQQSTNKVEKMYRDQQEDEEERAVHRLLGEPLVENPSNGGVIPAATHKAYSSECYDNTRQYEEVSELPKGACSHHGQEPDILSACVTCSPNDMSVTKQDWTGEDLVSLRQDERHSGNNDVDTESVQKSSEVIECGVMTAITSQQAVPVCQDECRVVGEHKETTPRALEEIVPLTRSLEVEVPTLHPVDVQLPRQGGNEVSSPLCSLKESLGTPNDEVGNTWEELASDLVSSTQMDTGCRSKEAREETTLSPNGATVSPEHVPNVVETQGDMRQPIESVSRTLSSEEEGPVACVTNSVSFTQSDGHCTSQEGRVLGSMEELPSVPEKPVPAVVLKNNCCRFVEHLSNGTVNGSKEHGLLDCNDCEDASVPVVGEDHIESTPGILFTVPHSDPCDIPSCDGREVVKIPSGKAAELNRVVPDTVAVTGNKTDAYLAKSDCESNSSTNFDVNQVSHKGEALIENCFVTSCEESTVTTNDAISNAMEGVSKCIANGTYGLNDHKQSVQDFLANERVHLVHEVATDAEDMSLSVCGGKDQRQDALSSVILGPCEDFTLEYFKGLKTTFPDPNPLESSIVHSELEDSNIDYSINGWDEFLGKTLEKQDCSQYEDITFPSLVIEQGPSQTARNIENIFESITDLQNDVTVAQSPSVVSIKAPISQVLDVEQMSAQVELGNCDVSELKSLSARPLKQCENSPGYSDDVACRGLKADSCGRADSMEDRPSENSQERSCCNVGGLSEEENGFSPPGFHANVEGSDGLREMDEDNDEFAEFALDVKHCTPDDERSSDSGFRDKGSLSESCEDACDEKYNLEDIEAELEETFNQGGFNYKLEDEESEAFQAQDRFASPEPPLEIIKTLKVVDNFPEGVHNHDVNLSFISELEKTPNHTANHVESSSSQAVPNSLSLCSIPLDIHSTSLFKPHTVDEYMECSQTVDFMRENVVLGDNILSSLPSHVDSRPSLQVSKDINICNLTGESVIDNIGAFDNGVNVCDIEAKAANVTDELQSTQLVEKLSSTRRGGWYLHPPDGTQVEAVEDFLSPKSESSTSSIASKHDDSENSYVSYHLDEEYVTAIRNELREKLPCANQSLDSDSEEDIVDEEEGAEDRQDIMIHYNMYPAPLSPILEERESVSSLDYSPYINSLNFDSDPESLVFSLDSQEEVKKELESRKFEEDIREALENVSYESSTSSSDRDPNTTVLMEDLDTNVKQKVVKIRGTSTEVEDDVLVVNTETNEVSLVESAIPKLQLAFVNKRTIDQPAIVQTPDFLRDEETLAIDSGTFVIGKSRFDDNFEGSSEASPVSSGPDHALRTDIEKPQQGKVPEVSENNGGNDIDCEHTKGNLLVDNCTPDSVSPTTASDRTIPSTDMEDISDFYLTPPSDSSPGRHLPYPTPILHQPEIKCAAIAIQQTTNEPTFEKVQDISLNFANNEAADIISDLQDCGIIRNTKTTSNENIVHLMTSEIYDYQDSTESSDEKYSPRSLEDDFEEMISFEEYSESSESREYRAPTPESQMSVEFARSKPDFTTDMSPVQRLDFLTTSIGIVSESNDDCFDDELERTLRLNDLGNILKLNSNSTQEGKSLPSPNINPSAKDIIVNFVKCNKQHLELLSNHPEENLKCNQLEELNQINNECYISESLNKVGSNHIDSSCESATISQVNEVSSESPSSGCSLKPAQTLSSPVSQDFDSKQEETEKKDTRIVSNGDIILQVVKQLGPLNDRCESEAEKRCEDVSESSSVCTTLVSTEVGLQDIMTCSVGEDEVKSGIKLVVQCQGSIGDVSDDGKSMGKHCIQHDVKQEHVEESCTSASLEAATIEDCHVQNLAKQVIFLEETKENGPEQLLSNKSGGEVTDADDLTTDLKNLESSLEDWSHFMGSTKAPMPSPEEESWRHLSSSVLMRAPDISSSMLGFPDVKSSPNGSCSTGDSKNSPLSEVLFEPDISTSMLGFSDEKGSKMLELSFTGPGFEDGEMSTSFSAPGEEEEEEEYAPDWESDSDGSSSSGEFIWREGDRVESQPHLHTGTRYLNKPYDCLPEFPMEAIAEEDEDEEDEDDDDEDSSLGSGTEFVPSAWDSQATPSRSALRSPDKKTDTKKNVWFKKQKYHCVYEYPRENSDTESEASETGFADSCPWRSNAVHQTNQLWQSQTPSTTTKSQGSWQPPAVDYAAYADWEVTDGDGTEQDTDTESDNQTSQQLKAEPFDFYKLSSVDYDFSTGVMSEDGEFFISSTARPFQQLNATPNSLFTHSSSEFFPGQSLDQPPTSSDSTDRPDTFVAVVDSFGDEIDTSPRNIAAPKLSPLLLSGLAADNTIRKAKVVSSDVSSGALGDKQINSEDTNVHICIVNSKDKDTEKGEIGTTSAVPLSLKRSGEGIVHTDGSEREFSDSSQTPPSPLSPTGLGELRHTRDKLKLNLPSTNGAFLVDVGGKWGRSLDAEDVDTNTTFLLDAPGKRGLSAVERGEASLLDSGEDTEDSGIESSNGMSATVTLKTTLEENLNNALANAH